MHSIPHNAFTPTTHTHTHACNHTSTGEELRQYQKMLNEFAFDMAQLQTQLDSVQREKSVQQSKSIELERMHLQMKEAMTADLNYLRRLNLQFVEQQMKGRWEKRGREGREEGKEGREGGREGREEGKEGGGTREVGGGRKA